MEISDETHDPCRDAHSAANDQQHEQQLEAASAGRFVAVDRN
jgi:hypothetical protein